MQVTVLPLPAHAPAEETAQAIERVCAAAGLDLTLKRTLKKYPGSRHWHYRRGRSPGTLEITLGPDAFELRFKIQEGRRAPWIDALLPQLQADIARELSRGGNG